MNRTWTNSPYPGSRAWRQFFRRSKKNFVKPGKSVGSSDVTVRWHSPSDEGSRSPEEPRGAGRSGGIQEEVIALYEAHREAVYRFLVRQGLSPEVAQEVMQDVFVDLFVALEKGTEMNSEQGWLYAVAGRAAIDHWRRNAALP